MTTADVPAGLALCRASGWNQTARDWKHFLSANGGGALVAELNGRVIGTAATLPYGPFTWISMVLVDPAVRGRGIGRRLLHEGLDRVPPGSTARLDATPAGEVLYRKLGFAGEARLARWFLDSATPHGVAVSDVRPLVADDWPSVHDLDARAFGASRARLLEHLAEHDPQYAWVAHDRDRLRGYVVGRHGHVREHVGPLVARDVDTAQALLHACLASAGSRGVFIDVPDDQQAWTAVLSASGFAIERPFLRMHRGPLAARGEHDLVFAIGGPEFG